ncbi:amidohydrolase family protein [Amycolatopsis sp. NPDC051102]|uniref:amidohydrolase family protein n=1 Tax=Amycolatopsis sp. NPDC051102 TaxID=3155163 RepID=UPI00343712D0
MQIDDVELLDHHCHGVRRGEIDGHSIGSLLTESDSPPPRGTSFFDSQLGFAVRRWCAPVLGLPARAGEAEYLQRRLELGSAEAGRALLTASGLAILCVDDGFPVEELLTVAEMAELSGRPARRVVRLEAVAEAVAASAVSAAEFADAFAARLAHECSSSKVVGLKSVIGYRLGLDFEACPPEPSAVVTAAGEWLRDSAGQPGAGSLRSEVLLRHVLYTGARHGAENALPLQFHTGLGDTSLHLRRVDPLHLTDFLRQVQRQGTQVVLLHGYPYHRHAAYLAHVFPHAWVDVGLSLNYVGASAQQVLSEVLELAPFGKVLFSTDAYGLPELYHLGAVLFRRAMTGLCEEAVRAGDWSTGDAERVARMVAGGNARRLYSRLAY